MKLIIISILMLLSVTLMSCSSKKNDDNSPSTSKEEAQKKEKDPEKQKKEEPEGVVSVERISLSGLAIKGVASQALVEAYKLNDAGKFETTPFAQTLTDSEGHYQLEEDSKYDKPIKLVIKQNGDNNAKLQCDAPDGCGSAAFGDFYDMPADFRLSAVIVNGQINEDLTARTANLSALTTIASERLEKEKNIDGDAARKANTQVRALFGLPAEVNITTTEAANITRKGEGNLLYGLINAAFEQIASEDKQPVSDIIRKFASDIASDGQLLIRSKDERKRKTSLWYITTIAKAVAKNPKVTDRISTREVEKELSDKVNKIESDDSLFEKQTDVEVPVISAGKNLKVETGSKVTLKASVKFGSINSYQWKQISGSKVSLNNATTAEAGFTAPVIEGVLKFMVTGKDTKSGLGDADVVRVIVKEKPVTDFQSVQGDYNLLHSSVGINVNGGNKRFETRLDSTPATLRLATVQDTLAALLKGGDYTSTSMNYDLGSASLSADEKIATDKAQVAPVSLKANKSIEVFRKGSDEIKDEGQGIKRRKIKPARKLIFHPLADNFYMKMDFRREVAYSSNNQGVFSWIPSDLEADAGIDVFSKMQDIAESALSGKYHGLSWSTQYETHDDKNSSGSYSLSKIDGESQKSPDANKIKITSNVQKFTIEKENSSYALKEFSFNENHEDARPVSGLAETSGLDEKSGASYKTLGVYGADGTRYYNGYSYSGGKNWPAVAAGSKRKVFFGIHLPQPSGNVDLTGSLYQFSMMGYDFAKDSSRIDLSRETGSLEFTAEGIDIYKSEKLASYNSTAQKTNDILRFAYKKEPVKILWTETNASSPILTNGQLEVDIKKSGTALKEKLMILTNKDGKSLLIANVFEDAGEVSISIGIAHKVN